MNDLTEKQSAFVHYLVRTGCRPTEAARRAGYNHPKNAAYDLLRKPHIVESVRQEQGRSLDGDLANVALQTLRDVMNDKKSPASARVSASRAVLEASGHFKRPHDDIPPEERSPLDMSQKELEAFVIQSRETLSALRQSAGQT